MTIATTEFIRLMLRVRRLSAAVSDVFCTGFQSSSSGNALPRTHHLVSSYKAEASRLRTDTASKKLMCEWMVEARLCSINMLIAQSLRRASMQQANFSIVAEIESRVLNLGDKCDKDVSVSLF